MTCLHAFQFKFKTLQSTYTSAILSLKGKYMPLTFIEETFSPLSFFIIDETGYL